MPYTITYTKQAANFLRKLPQKHARVIRSKLATLAKTGEHPMSLKLTGHDGYRLRVGNYRVIYTRHDEILAIQVIKIATRGEVYK